MKSLIFVLGFIVILLSVAGCKKKPDTSSSNASSFAVYQRRNPIGVFCGTDCANCGFNVTKCLTLLKENLTNLCDGRSKANCYMLWLSYSKTCYAFCADKKEK